MKKMKGREILPGFVVRVSDDIKPETIDALKEMGEALQKMIDRKMCVRCGKHPVYVSPKGHVSVKCAICLYDDFVELGVLENEDNT